MKRFSKLFLALLVAIILTGCVDYKASMKVNDDKSVTLVIEYSNGGATDFPDSTVEEFEWMKEYGFEVKEVKENDGLTSDEEEDDYSDSTGVIKISKKYDHIDDITNDNAFQLDFVELFDKEKKEQLKDLKFFYKKDGNYVANYTFNFLGKDATEDERNNAESDNSNANLSYKIVLPVEVGNNNADKVSDDGKTLKWDLTYSEVNNVNFEFSLGGFNWLIVALAVAFALVFIVIIVILLNNNKKKKQAMMNNGMPVNPGQPPMGNQMPGQQPMGNPMPDQGQSQMFNPAATDFQQPMINPMSEVQPEAPALEPLAPAPAEPGNTFINEPTSAEPMSMDQPGAVNPLLNVNLVPVDNAPVAEETPVVENPSTDVVVAEENVPTEEALVDMPAEENKN